MTEDEHIKLVEVGNHFWDTFSKLVAECLDMLPDGMDETEALYYLSDHSSVFGTNFEKYRKL